MPSLTRTEAEARRRAITVTSMVLDLDLTLGESQFGSRTEIRFAAREPQTFVDLRPVEVRSLSLNGRPLDASALVEGRLALTDLAAENVLVVDAVMAFSKDGQGLHRSVDPADGRAYVYGHLFLDAAPTVFACFDQPDLKAPYDVRVTAPAGDIVVGNGAATQESDGQWRLATTPPLATYFVTVCVGPYVSVLDEHDGVPLGVHARTSLREPLERQAEQIFEVTKAGFDYYHELFGIRYPFGEYHQVFAPEFNAGAMENPGCVVIRDPLLYRGAATHDEILTRTNTIVHELAHMWFGDLVTMTWWDDLWLNESFAEYMAHRTCVAATEFTDAWVDSTLARKVWGHAAERAPSRHPVAGAPAPDAQSALTNFDGISYAKGSAVLRQLIAYIGDDVFIAGVADYLRSFSFGNGRLADFLAAIEKSSGRDLSGWSKVWLETEGLDRITVDAPNGRVNRETPTTFPQVSRPHTFDVAGFDAGREVYRVSGTIEDAQSDWPQLAAAGPAGIVIPNASDDTWASIGLDSATLAQLPAGLGRIPDPQARSVAWLALIDGVLIADIDPMVLVETFGQSWPLETNDSILNRVSTYVLARTLPVYVEPSRRTAAEEVVCRAAMTLLDNPPSPGASLIAARCIAQSSTDEALLRRWLAGDGVPAALADDSDFRWFLVKSLARQGFMDASEIEGYRLRDESLAGQQAALAANTLRPEAAAKAWAWSELTTNPQRSNYDLNAIADAFWVAPAPELVRDYLPRYFAEIPALGARLGEDALGNVAALAYPLRLVEPATLDASRAALAGDDLSPAVRRAMVDGQARLEAALASRAAFA